ncbi:hypothetical protein D3C87_1824920 [compost metagenome]
MVIKVFEQLGLKPYRLKHFGEGSIGIQDLVIVGTGPIPTWLDHLDIVFARMQSVRYRDSEISAWFQESETIFGGEASFFVG